MGTIPRPSLGELERTAEAAALALKRQADQHNAMVDAAMAKAPPGLDDRQQQDMRADLLAIIRDAYWVQVCEAEEADEEAKAAVAAEEQRQQQSGYLGSVL